MKPLVAFVRKRRLELLLGCDANSHHLVWGSTDSNSRDVSLLEFIKDSGLHILNRGKELVATATI